MYIVFFFFIILQVDDFFIIIFSPMTCMQFFLLFWRFKNKRYKSP